MTRHEYLAAHHAYHLRGEALPHSRLTADIVRSIRANRHGWTARRWADHLGVHIRTVDKVRTYQSWRHVT